MGRGERDGIDYGAGWSISRFMSDSRSATFKGNGAKTRCADSRDGQKRMESDFSKEISRVYIYIYIHMRNERISRRRIEDMKSRQMQNREHIVIIFVVWYSFTFCEGQHSIDTIRSRLFKMPSYKCSEQNSRERSLSLEVKTKLRRRTIKTRPRKLF